MLCKIIIYFIILDVEGLVRSFMKKTTDEYNTTVWECVQCGKVSKISTNLKDPIEANHIENMQLECPCCMKIFKSRPSLRKHMRLHRELQWTYNLWKYEKCLLKGKRFNIIKKFVASLFILTYEAEVILKLATFSIA